MQRRLILACTVAAALLGGPGQAETLTEQIIAQLQRQGYTQIKVSRTWLGRIRVEAEGQRGEREIVFNPNSGEILRDTWELDDDDNDEKGDGGGILGSNGGSGSHSGSGGGNGQDDDQEEDDDEEDDDGKDDDDGDSDSSGSSGSGSGDDDDDDDD